MKHSYKNPKTAAECRLLTREAEFDRVFYGKDHKEKLLTIAWNRGQSQAVVIDEVQYHFPGNSILCLMVNQSFHFAEPYDIVAWQFNREFYCIENHDREVSCVGFLFYGSGQMMFINPARKQQVKIGLLSRVFEEEFEVVDDIQEDMLRMLLKRLIIIITRIAKSQFINHELSDAKLDIVRRFNLLVEKNYKTQHRVKYYAEQLNRSPKTLANLFALYNNKSPLAVIQDRIFLEAKRLFTYTDKSSKEVAYELGFEDVSYFSNFFKKRASVPPTVFRKDKAMLIS